MIIGCPESEFANAYAHYPRYAPTGFLRDFVSGKKKPHQPGED
jgi:hypothetical protein